MANEKQVRANIDPDLHEEMTRAARRLGITLKEFAAQAFKAKLGKFDVDFTCKTLRAENTTLSVEKKQFRKERNEAHKQLATAENQTSQLKTECDRLEVDKSTLTYERDEALKQRDHFKGKHEEAQEAIGKLEADLKAYRERGWLDRLLKGIK